MKRFAPDHDWTILSAMLISMKGFYKHLKSVLGRWHRESVSQQTRPDQFRDWWCLMSCVQDSRAWSVITSKLLATCKACGTNCARAHSQELELFNVVAYIKAVTRALRSWQDSSNQLKPYKTRYAQYYNNVTLLWQYEILQVAALQPSDQILIIGISSEPQACVRADEEALTIFFTSRYLLSLPNYACRRVVLSGSSNQTFLWSLHRKKGSEEFTAIQGLSSFQLRVCNHTFWYHILSYVLMKSWNLAGLKS